jgi:hypothetical protein
MKKLILSGLAATLAVAIACGGDKSGSPASPSSTPVVSGTAAGPDGITLKVTAPPQISPANGVTLDTFSPVLTIGQSLAKFESASNFAYRFQLLNAGAVVKEVRVQALTWTPDSLENKKVYGWRARAESGSYFGPWSETWTFTTPDQPEGYINGGELYDPLYNGKTVGIIHGAVTFVPGVGVKLEGLSSYIQYNLQSTVTGGEFSILVTNMATNTEGGKTKVMAMSEGDSDITTNDRRFTIEKRGDPAGAIAWRVITSNDQIDTVGAERVIREFNPGSVYFWKATWGGNRFDLNIKNGGPNGSSLYSFGKNYRGTYDPNPHRAYIGGPAGRGGINSGTVPGIIVRQVWLSNRPRPAFANQ